MRANLGTLYPNYNGNELIYLSKDLEKENLSVNVFDVILYFCISLIH